MMYDDDEACGLHTIDRFACHYIITRRLRDLIQSIFSLGQTVLMLSCKAGLMGKIGYAHLCP